MRGLGGHGRGIAAALAAAGLALVAAACGPASGSTASGTGGSVAGSDGGTTVTWANSPGANGAFPFPMFGGGFTAKDEGYLNTGEFLSVANVNDFQYLMYRPLYWFGSGVNPYLNTQLSLAKPATFQGHHVTIQLKTNYKWSNGEAVDAQDVVFWMNMMKALGGNESYANTNGLPGNVTNVRAASKYVVTMDITTPKFSETWFSNNELSELTPMPMAWDRTASGPGHCATTVSACFAVFTYLTKQALLNPSTFASSPLWSIVDGPFKLQSLDSQGKATLVSNKHYSGPVAAHHITKFVELPFTSEQAEYNVLQDPTGSQTVDVGYLPTVDAPVPPAGASVGANPPSLSSYSLTSYYPWELTYFPYNFQNPTAGPIFKQLYFRQAFQSLVDQEGVISGPLHGYGQPTIGPVSDIPVTNYLSPALQKGGDKWTLNIGSAKKTLESNGWNIPSSGFGTCVKPGTGKGECGKGITRGTPLKFTLMYAEGIDEIQEAMRELASNASLAGIQVTLQAEPFGTVTGIAFTGTPKSETQWQLAEWGSWTYAPDYVPTGEELFEPADGAGDIPGNDAGFYNDPRDNTLINDTLEARTPAQLKTAMYNWEDYLAKQLPVVWEPNSPQLVETIKGLNIGPQNSALSITPELWHYGQ
ncbi:MAG TPA: ABC transporter substrate-binding protein [Streptosporangiaceae bacterium]